MSRPSWLTLAWLAAVCALLTQAAQDRPIAHSMTPAMVEKVLFNQDCAASERLSG